MKQDLKGKQFQRLYIFHGEETFLLKHYISQLKKHLLDPLTESFNYHRFHNENFDIRSFSEAVENLQKTYQEEKYRSVALEKRLMAAVAESYRGICNPLHFEETLTGSALRELAERIEKICGGAIVCAGNDESGYTVCVVGEDARGIGTRAAQALCGRGGGKQYAWQGFFKARRAQIEAYFGQ